MNDSCPAPAEIITVDIYFSHHGKQSAQSGDHSAITAPRTSEPSLAACMQPPDHQTIAKPSNEPTELFDPSKPLGRIRFRPRLLLATPGALALLHDHQVTALELLDRHVRGDWGDISAQDAALADHAVLDQQSVMSAYRLMDWHDLVSLHETKRVDVPTVWLITDDDHITCMLLLPDEF